MKNHTTSMLLSTAIALLATTGTSHAGLYSVDASFATSGRYNQSLPGSDFRTLAHLARPNGTSVAIATYDNNGCPAGRHCLRVYTFNVHGQLSAIASVPTSHSFSKRTASVGSVVLDSFLVKAAAVDSQGRIVIAGTEQFGSVFQFKVIRLLANGQADTSFDGDGIATPGSFTGRNDDVATSMAIDGFDRIVVAGRARFSATDTDFAVLRLTAAGALDTSFSGDGKLTIPFDLAGLGIDGAEAVAIRPGGQIYLAGTASDGSLTRIGLAKVLTTGTLDYSFCATSCTFQGPYTSTNNGKRVLFYGHAEDGLSDYVRSLAVNVSGEMVYAGLHETGPGNFRVFTQKVALNGDYANESLVDTGLGTSLDHVVGGIRYINPNSGTSDLVLTGAVGPGREFFFAQGINSVLAPVNGWGASGPGNSVLLYTASGSFGDFPGNMPAIPSIDAYGRVLIGGSYKAAYGAANYSINVMRLRR